MSSTVCTYCVDLTSVAAQAIERVRHAGPQTFVLVCPACTGQVIYKYKRTGHLIAEPQARHISDEYHAAYRLGGPEAVFQLRQSERRHE